MSSQEKEDILHSFKTMSFSFLHPKQLSTQYKLNRQVLLCRPATVREEKIPSTLHFQWPDPSFSNLSHRCLWPLKTHSTAVEIANAIQQLAYDRALDLSSENTVCISTSSSCELIISAKSRGKKARADGQDILKLSALLYVIPERNLVPDVQLQTPIQPWTHLGWQGPGLEEKALPSSPLTTKWGSLSFCVKGNRQMGFPGSHPLLPILV